MEALKILLVEDDDSIREILAFALSDAGYQPTPAACLAGARTALLNSPPDFAILDITLPDGDGLAFASELQTIQPTPFLFLTSRTSEADRIKGLKLGADDYVSKPFSVDELLLRIESIMRRWQSSPTQSGSLNTRTASPVLVDRDRHQVAVNGKPVELTLSEFEILATLEKHQGQVCRREMLLNQLSRDNLASADRSIDAHIKRLRSKLAPHGIDPIKTVRGVGYRYELD